MVSLRQKERKTYTNVLELPSDAESILSSDGDIVEDGHDAAHPKPSSRRKRPRSPDPADDSSSDEYRGDSADQEERDAAFEADMAEGDEGSQPSADEEGEGGTSSRGQSASLPPKFRFKREEPRKVVKPAHKDDLQNILAGPSVAKSSVDIRTNRQALMFASLPSKPFGHTKLKSRPELREAAAEIPSVQAHLVYGMTESDKYAWVHKFGENIRLEEPWDTWTGRPWIPKAGNLAEQGALSSTVPMDLEKLGEPQTLTAEQASKYMPAPGTIHCYFGDEESTPSVAIQSLGCWQLKSVANRGWVFNAGGPISGLAWKPELPKNKAVPQYLAIAPQSRPIMEHLPHNQTQPHDPRCSVQIWRLDRDAGLYCEMILCLDVEPLLDLKWVPAEIWPTSVAQGTGGILSGASADGRVYFFTVPHSPQAARAGKGKIQYLHVKPSFQLTAEEGAARCLAWSRGGRLAAGLLNGGLAIWTLRSNDFVQEKAPEYQDQYLQPHMASVKSLAWIKLPPCDSDGRAMLDALPRLLVSSSFDGATHISDAEDPAYCAAVQSVYRFPPTVSWAPRSDMLLHSDGDYWLLLTRLKRAGPGTSSRMHDHGGHVSSIAASDYHDMAVTGGADGTVRMSSMLKSSLRVSKARTLVEVLYQLDFNAKTDEYRMIDNILPEPPMPDAKYIIKSNAAKKGKADEGQARIISGGWAPHINILRVEWQSGAGLGNAGLLASASASGLGRIDMFSERATVKQNQDGRADVPPA